MATAEPDRHTLFLYNSYQTQQRASPISVSSRSSSLHKHHPPLPPPSRKNTHPRRLAQFSSFTHAAIKRLKGCFFPHMAVRGASTPANAEPCPVATVVGEGPSLVRTVDGPTGRFGEGIEKNSRVSVPPGGGGAADVAVAGVAAEIEVHGVEKLCCQRESPTCARGQYK